ncbi:hypothetical protein FHS16_004131 [Paenibacillus endophyticus]|uniref:Uncharacterized protein n=1 Tax=Paenibacillus endophyticus TaxID=1294268 RepID=A0A7W5CAD2_9BACL|nr:hypothetical protein [Paenibacillus endophyticus]MBB3154055.1 hypothetical protein [Paenibacillus endophyticus]
MNHLVYEYFIWSVGIGMTVVSLLLLREIRALKLGRTVQHMIWEQTGAWEGEGASAAFICLFLNMGPNNSEIVLALKKKYADRPLTVILNAPAWQANVLRKKINGQAIILSDETGKMGRHWGHLRNPIYIIIDQYGKIVKKDLVIH